MTAASDRQGLTDLIDEAFDYRGYVTVSRRDGGKLVGFIYDRTPTHVEMFDESATHRVRVAVDEIAAIELTGEDSAAKAQKIWERRKGSLEPPETSAWGDWAGSHERSVLIVVALPNELRGVAGVLGGTVRGAAVRGRLGASNAVAVAVGVGGGAAQIIAAEKPRLVISCGLSGALDPSLATGDIVLASSVRDESGESIAVAEPVLRAARQALAAARPSGDHDRHKLVEGEILCATQVAATTEEKRALARPGRYAVDLESGPVARAAQRAGIPWLALRVVFDPLDAELPAFTRTAEPSYVGPALRYALGGPRAMVQLAQLARRARLANRSLTQALGRLAAMAGSFTATNESESAEPIS
jgi:nucleoside phosphorylase